jgi:predicted lysophospholipase L1 biosynthesis ABC-type transport system permease subunit
MPNERAAITIPGARELPKAIPKRVRVPGRRPAAIAAIAAVVVVAIAAAFVPLSSCREYGSGRGHTRKI